MRFLFALSHFFVNQLLGATQANFLRILSVNSCRLDFQLETNLTKFSKDSNTNETRGQALEKQFSPSFNEKDPSVIKRGSTSHELKKKVTVPVQTDYALIAALYLTAWYVFIITFRARKHSPPLEGESSQRRLKNRLMDEVWQQYVKKKRYE